MESQAGSRSIRSVAACAAFALALTSLHAQAPQKAPINPAFLQYQQERAQQDAAPAGSRNQFGEVPTPVDFSYLKGRTPAGMRALQALPSAYDLRTLNKLTPIKNQDPYGTCWAFATYGSLESALLPGETNNFSENNLANNHGFDYAYDAGGQHLMSTAYLTRWSGPIDTTDDPYTNGPGHSPSNLTVRKHVQEVLVLPLKTSDLDNDVIKQAVVNYGAMYISMFYVDACYNSNNATYYYSDASVTNGTGHAVAIVGWTNDYPAGNFTPPAPGNGAFIVRNSWGTTYGEQGYFYCSYYDKAMGYRGNAAFNNADPVANYSGLYEYDPLGWVSSTGYSDTNAWAANIFPATNNATLRAVGFYTTDIDTRYEIYIYRNVTAGSPRSGTLESIQTGSQSFSGYHTVVLNNPAPVTSGELFSVVIRFVNSAYTYPLAYECAQAKYSSRATSSPGQSFVSQLGGTWSDMTTSDPSANVCIKAYVGAGAATPPVAPPVAGDYDGDGKADPAVYQESSGRWILLLSANGFARVDLGNGYLGVAGCRGITADYDGDGKADPAIYQDSTGDWSIRLSASGYATAAVSAFGGAGYTPLAADFDGDRKADPAVYQEATGLWIIKLSGSGYLIATLEGFGGAGYSAITADYDGDGKADPAIYEESTGNWFIKLSASGYLMTPLSNFGSAGCLPVAADFDADRKADPAVQNPATGAWYIKLSASGYAVATLEGFGGAGYGKAFAADYDGDGKADPALYRSSTGTWYFRLSASGYSQATGSSGYIP